MEAMRAWTASDLFLFEGSRDEIWHLRVKEVMHSFEMQKRNLCKFSGCDVHHSIPFVHGRLSHEQP